MTDAREPDAVVDLLGGTGTGPLWGMASSDLNATLLAWPPGHELAADTNSELDVLLIVVEGGGVATVDEQEHALVPGSALLIEKGSSRTIRADADGVRYVSVHRRRGPLQITWPGSRAASSAPTTLCGGSSGTTERRRVEAELREAQRSFEASRDEVRVLADEQAALRLVATPHWLNHYNEQRRHSAIGNQPPISRVRNLPGQDS